MRVLVACEFSGTVRDAFTARGHHALSCDLLPSDRPGNHYQGNVFDVINDGWDLMIGHPPCTYLCNSGVQFLKRPGRVEQMEQGAEFFKKLLNANIERVCIENPIMHGYAKRIIGINQSQLIQPYQFGHDAKKSTCLWLKNLPLLVSTDIIIKKRYANQTPGGYNNLPQSADRWRLRSKTYAGIAGAMAMQWGVECPTPVK